MSWVTVPAFQKSTGNPLATASMQKNKAGQLKLTLFLSTFLVDRLGGGDTIEAQVGTAEHAGLLRLVPGITHQLTSGIKGSRRLTIAHFDGLPMDAHPGTPCKVEKDDAGEVILRLPLSDWVRRLPAPTVQVDTAKAPATAAPPTPVKSKPVSKDDDRVDLVSALREYDRRIARVIEGLFLVEGERVEVAEVLELLNSYRRRNQLRPLTPDQVK